jgi:uncharacterized glyoxalase superfamily protein PhnB
MPDVPACPRPDIHGSAVIEPDPRRASPTRARKCSAITHADTRRPGGVRIPAEPKIAMLTNRSMPATTVIPVLVYEDVPEAIEWLCDAFGFRERERVGDYWAYLAIGDGAMIVRGRRVSSAFRTSDPVMLRPPRPGEVSHTVMVRVEDVDDHYRRARQSGAWILEPLADFPYGERQYTAKDLEGHRWVFSQTIRDVAPDEWGAHAVEPEQ